MKNVLLLVLLLASPLSYAGPLEDVLERVQSAKVEGEVPVVIFDLDDTLFDSRSRKIIIQKEFANLPSTRLRFPNEAKILSQVELRDIAYAVKDTMKNLGITDKDFIREATAYWASTFFSDDYVVFDETIAGAVDYVQKVQNAGAIIVYLTGRDIPRMEQGTLQSFQKHDLPWNKFSRLFMKPHKDLDDTDFKKEVLEEITTLGKVVASFENEPRNINAMRVRFPQAQMVFLNTLHSNKPDAPHPSIPHIKNYL